MIKNFQESWPKSSKLVTFLADAKVAHSIRNERSETTRRTKAQRGKKRGVKTMRGENNVT